MKPVPAPKWMIPILILGALGFLAACVLKMPWVLVGAFFFALAVVVMVVYLLYKSNDELNGSGG